MAKKPRSEWSDAYRRRVEKAEAAGKSRQAARGHRQKEHVARKERETVEAKSAGKLTSPERAYVRKMARELSRRSDSYSADAVDRMLRYAQRVGIEHFKRQVRAQQQMVRQYRREVKMGIYSSRGEQLLTYLADHDDGFPDHHWYYYH